jgi:allophycocyanin-B
MADAIRCLKTAALALLDAADAEVASDYFDYVIQALS